MAKQSHDFSLSSKDRNDALQTKESIDDLDESIDNLDNGISPNAMFWQDVGSSGKQDLSEGLSYHC